MSQTHLPCQKADLEQRIASRILERTGRRVHDLTVEVTTEGVLVRGYAFSYYALQLALSAVREVLDAMPVRMDIAVLADNPRSPERYRPVLPAPG